MQQGDPLGSLGFTLTLHHIIERIKVEIPTLALNAWYLNDSTLVGSPGDISAALQIIESVRLSSQSVGLHLNRGKPLLYIPRDCHASHSPLPPEVPSPVQVFVSLAAPSSPLPFVRGVLQDRVVRIRESLEILHKMDDSQLETTLIRSCLVLPKFSYLIRTCPPNYITWATRDFDVAMRALESILGGPLSEWSWLKPSLPSSLGGVNLRSASLHAPAAFLSSSSRSQT